MIKENKFTMGSGTLYLFYFSVNVSHDNLWQQLLLYIVSAILKIFPATYKKFRLYKFLWNMFTFPVAWNNQQMSRLGLF